MSKLSMRARKLDHGRPLKVFRTEEIPDLEEHSQYGRGVIQIATGVEKEEEEEHHLQAVISASQVDGPGGKDIYIPIPDASTRVNHYNKVYTQTFQFPTKLIRGTPDVEWNDTYDLDDEDLEWIQKVNKGSKKINEEQFETLITRFEQVAKDMKELPESIENFGQVSTQIPQAVLNQVFEYWKAKRSRLKCGSMVYPLKPETVSNDPDPYVCFRRRELRPIRKTRRNDQQSYDRMVKLRNEMDRARNLMELVKKRDRLKKESVSLDFLIFEQKAKIWDLRRIFQIPNTSIEIDNQAPELKKQPKPKPKQTVPPPAPSSASTAQANASSTSTSAQAAPSTPPAPQPKIRLNINGGVVRSVSTDAPSNTDDNIIHIPGPQLNPTPTDEQELLEQRFLDRQLAAIDPEQATLPTLESLVQDPSEAIYTRRPASDYEDLTDVAEFDLIRPLKKLRHRYEDLPEQISAKVPFLQRGRRRLGRGGRVIFDRPSTSFQSSEVSFPHHNRYHFGMSDSEDEEFDLDSETPRSVVSVPMPFYTLNELSILNGTSQSSKPKLPPPAARRPNESISSNLSSNLTSPPQANPLISPPTLASNQSPTLLSPPFQYAGEHQGGRPVHLLAQRTVIAQKS